MDLETLIFELSLKKFTTLLQKAAMSCHSGAADKLFSEQKIPVLAGIF
jgi:hypothetical protein